MRGSERDQVGNVGDQRFVLERQTGDDTTHAVCDQIDGIPLGKLMDVDHFAEQRAELIGHDLDGVLLPETNRERPLSADPTKIGLHGEEVATMTAQPVDEEDHATTVVGEPFERTLPGGLRTLYPLVVAPHAGVFRRIVRYDLPPLQPDRPRG